MNARLRTMLHDIDPAETREWLESLDALVARHGVERAHFILTTLLKHARVEHVALPALVQTPYINTIAPEEEPPYPGDLELERRIRRYIRWNAVVMVMRANERFPGIGGHLSTYASAASLYEVGYNHFFRGREGGALGDQIFFQGHASPGIYARAFLEGRISEAQMHHFRREVEGKGLPSYPHPRLMPDFWAYPTVSMGLGPIAAIFQARFNRYMAHRGLKDTEEARVWAFVGDGETDEPEALGALHVASRERLSNLIFVVNCNLQRLDGPVRGNGKIIQELEAVFHGAGWRVIKVIWGSEWDPLLARDTSGLLVKRMGEAVDGDYQKYSVEDGGYARRHFFGKYPELLKLVEHLSDEEIHKLRRGGHDMRKVFAAYDAACKETEQPTVILAKTIKGWTLGEGTEGRNVTHQQKKLTLKELLVFRDRLELDIPDRVVAEDPPFIRFEPGSREYEYLMARRAALGGPVPAPPHRAYSIPAPEVSYLGRFLKGSQGVPVSTTGAFVRMLGQLLGEKRIGPHLVPIIPDEARTFGLDALFRKYGIYSSVGQVYEPVDAKMLLSYREAKDGQVLEEGICEAGAMASFLAAGSAYGSLGVPMVPMYIFYSMFGFQRTGDQIWQAGDQRCRGFLLGATAGRTTLMGEGLQHCDGHSPLIAAAHPHVETYDPAYAYEVAVIIQAGLRRMLEEEENVVFYLTLYNEAYPMPPMPEGVEAGILEGMYLLAPAEGDGPRARLLASGPMVEQALAARRLLGERHGVAAEVWSVTSFGQLRREALACEARALEAPGEPPPVPLVTRRLQAGAGPVVAVTDYVTAVPDQVARWVPGGLLSLGTDGFGLSDTRAALRRFFRVDAEHIALAALARLAREGRVETAVAARAAAAMAEGAALLRRVAEVTRPVGPTP